MEIANRIPLVSVIIPNYNHAQFLAERIESVLNQTFQDFEIIILDDCSKDNSKEIINQYKNHPKVSHIVFNQQNSGSTFKQWQKGLNLAKGEYIWIAESDDVADQEFLECLMSKIIESKENIVLAFSNIDFIDKDSHLIINRKSLISYQPKSIVKGEYFIKHNMIYGNHILNASSVIFKKGAALKIPDDFVYYKGAGDYLFWIEIAKQGNIYKESKVLDHFRQHDSKVTPNSVASGTQFKEVYKVYQYLLSQGYVKGLTRQRVVGFWLHRINQERTNFFNTEIYDMCKSIWSNEVKVSSIAKFLYFINGIFRRHKKKFWGYGR